MSKRIKPEGNILSLTKRTKVEHNVVKPNRKQIVQPYVEACKTALRGTDDPALIEEIRHLFTLQLRRIDLSYQCIPGSIVVFGSPENHVCGLGKDEADVSNVVPTKIKGLNNVRAVDAGGSHTVALTTDGRVYGWGVNEKGAFGVDVEVREPIEIDFQDALQVRAGEAHTLFLNIHGQVYISGMYRDKHEHEYHPPSNEGESPRGFNAKPRPLKMPGGKKALRVESGCGSNFSVAILEDGSLATVGFGSNGELGRLQNMTKPDSEGGFDAWYDSLNDEEIVKHFLTPELARFASPGPPFPYPTKQVVDVACGAQHLLALVKDQNSPYTTLYSCGSNSSGQLGLEEAVEKVAELTKVKSEVGLIAAGDYFSLAVEDSCSYLYACGQNSYCQLGIGPPSNSQYGWKVVKFPEPVKFQAIQAGGSVGMALSMDNIVYTWGFGESGATGHRKNPADEVDGDVFRPTVLKTGTKTVLGLAAGSQHSLVLEAEE